MDHPRGATSVWWTLFVCLCCSTLGVLGNPGGVREVDTVKPVPSLLGDNEEKSLQSVLYSIEERLRGLDLIYAPRYQSRNWESEQNTRRLDAIDAQLARIEAQLQVRMDKVVEEVCGNLVQQKLSNERLERKVDSLYDRLNHRMHNTEDRLGLGVTKIQSIIESGLVRLGRTERDSDSIEADFETQLSDMQKQFDNFETTQNASVSMLNELSSNRCKRGELNDAENVVRDFKKQDIEQFATSMENVATKVNKMVTDFGQRTQSMELMVKNSMSLANATRRELQDGLRSLGRLRIVYHETKHNKEKENSFVSGWDALAGLVVSEFGNLGERLAANHNTLIAAQEDFRDNCHRLQDQELQLEGQIATVINKILEITDNKSQEVAKQLRTLGEIIKSSHHGDSRRHDSREKSIETIPQRLNAIDDILLVIKEQVSELAALNAANEEAKENCLDASQVADKVAQSIDSRQVSIEETSRRVAEKVIAFINASRNEDKVFNDDKVDEDEEFLQLEEYANKAEKESKRATTKRKSYLDIAEEDLGSTLEYNVTEDVEAKGSLAEGLRGKENTGESSEFEFDKSRPEGDADYDDDDDGTADIDEPGEISSKKLGKDLNIEDVSEKRNKTKINQSVDGDIIDSGPTNLSGERNQGGVRSTEIESTRNKEEYVEGDKTNFTRADIDPPKFSEYWHRLKNVNASDLSGNVDIKVSSKGQAIVNSKTAGKGEDEASHGSTNNEDPDSANNLQLRLDHHVNVHHEDKEYDYSD